MMIIDIHTDKISLYENIFSPNSMHEVAAQPQPRAGRALRARREPCRGDRAMKLGFAKLGAAALVGVALAAGSTMARTGDKNIVDTAEIGRASCRERV